MSDRIPWDAGEFAPGAQVAGYLLEEQVGRGGMAVVYRAHDVRLDRRVALKILSPGLASDEAFRQRFMRESRAAAAVDHPNIIPVFEAGEARGVLFIAMRYVEGRDVRTLLERAGPLPAERVAGIIAQMASALDAAHARGLVHRDVKPANMLLDSTAGRGRTDHVYLSDFGLSKQSLAPADLTSAGQFLGTLDYVAPEQIEGRRVDGRTDLYALACTAFEMLCGTPPFERDQRMAILWAQLSEPPPALTARRPDLPPAVDEVMAKALAKSPDDRYPRCLDFAESLRVACLPEAAAEHAVGAGDGRPADGQADMAGAQASGGEASGPGSTEVAGGGARMGGAEVAGAAGTAMAADAGRPPADAGPLGGDAGALGGEPTDPGPPDRGRQPPTEPGPPVRGQPFRGQQSAYPPGPRPVRPPGPLTGPPYGPPTGPPYGPPTGPPGPPFSADGGTPPSRRGWMRSRAALVVACVAIVAIAGTLFAIHNAGKTKPTAHAALSVPGCSTATATAKALTTVKPTAVSLPGKPFAVAVTPGGHWTFVTLGTSVAVMRNGRSLAPSLVRTFAVSAPRGEALTNDGRYLLVATGNGAIVINAQTAEQGGQDPVIGTLSSPGGAGAVQVTVSPDDRFAFVTLEGSRKMAVFNLRSALIRGFGPSNLVGNVPLGVKPTGVRLSSDGRWLYVTSQERSPGSGEGTLSVLDLRRAETQPRTSVVSTVPAGCGPVRAINSDDSTVVWVTARESNAVLAFSAGKLRSDKAHALLAWVRVGTAPIGLTFVNHGSRIVVADSDLFGKGAKSSLAVIDTSAALAGRPALLGLVKTGLLPRQFTVEPSGTLLVTNYGAGRLQAIATADLP